MASIDKRNGRWRARWRTPDGFSRSKTFDRKVDAERYLTSVEHSKLSGAYVDPAAGKVTFRDYAEAWRQRQVWRDGTATRNEIALRRQVYPHIGNRPMASIRQSEVQSLVKSISCELSPRTVEYAYRLVASVFRSAVLDKVVPASPCLKVTLPKIDRPKVAPLSVEAVQAFAAAMPPRYRAAVIVAAGSGLRMGEVLGLTVDRVDFLRRTITVDRQLVTPGAGPPILAPPKTAASSRVVPVGQLVIDELARHLCEHGEGPDRLVFVNEQRRATRRQRFSDIVRVAAEAAGLKSITFHDLRHHFPSVLIGAGCSVKAVQEALGHANASETLDTYSHLWPADEDRIRGAIDEAWSGLASRCSASG